MALTRTTWQSFERASRRHSSSGSPAVLMGLSSNSEMGQQTESAGIPRSILILWIRKGNGFFATPGKDRNSDDGTNEKNNYMVVTTDDEGGKSPVHISIAHEIGQ